MKNIVCMKWGTLYGPEFVNKLYAMARRHTTGDLRFVCLTDDPAGVRDEVECLPCPEVQGPDHLRITGWRKVALWGAELPGMEGDWLFLDLDVVVTGSLDGFFTEQPEKTFMVMQNWTQPGQGIGNTSVYRFRVNSHPYLLERLEQDFMSQVDRYTNEQTFVSKEISEIGFWPDAWCLLFKVHCVPSWPARFWKTPVLPDNARVVAFPGDPNPDDAAIGHWPVRKGWKKLYKHIKPVPWVAENWAD